jgi:uncharacterized damage-inducible protein DinB
MTQPQPPQAVSELLEKMREERLRFLRAIRQFTEESASQPLNGGWSVKQQLAHLAMAERGWRDWGLAIRDQPGLVFGPPQANDQPFEVSAREANTQSLQHWLTYVRSVRAETLKALERAGLQEAHLVQKGRHRGFGEMNVIQALRSVYRHDRMHLDQAFGREPTYQPGRRQA